jgi:site-specific recombinase XerD
MSSTSLTLCPVTGPAAPAVFASSVIAERRFWEFFVAQISNDATRKSYFTAALHFAAWCQSHGIAELQQVEPMQVAAYLKSMERDGRALPTVKVHLAALRMLFDWLVMGHVLGVNPARAVRGPRYIVRKGKTPALTVEETRGLLDKIQVARNVKGQNGIDRQEPVVMGLRDRALIGVMAYSFARVNAALRMRVRDYFVQGGRGWLHLHEKGGKEYDVPCHHNLERYLDEYISGARIAGDPDGPLFRTTGRKTGKQHSMWQQDAYRMIQRRARAAGTKTRVSNHTFRTTGITAFLQSGGRLEVAQKMAGHESPWTTLQYDRRPGDITHDEVERIAI